MSNDQVSLKILGFDLSIDEAVNLYLTLHKIFGAKSALVCNHNEDLSIIKDGIGRILEEIREI